MKRTTLRHRISESKLSLGFVLLFCMLLPNVCSIGFINGIFFSHWRTNHLWASLANLIALVGFALLYQNLNHRFSLLRTRSQLLLLLFPTACLFSESFFVFSAQTWALIFAAWLGMERLFAAYGDRRAVGAVFWTALVGASVSLFYAPALLLLPFVLIGAFVFLRMGSWRTLSAALLGLLLPYALGFAATLLLPEQTQPLLSDWLHHWSAFAPANRFSLSLPPIFAYQAHYWAYKKIFYYITLGVLLCFMLVGVSNVQPKSLNDKLRTRDYYHFLLAQLVGTVLLWGLVGRSAHCLTPLFCWYGTPFIAHYFALNKRKLSDWLFWLFVGLTLLFMAVRLFNLLYTLAYTLYPQELQLRFSPH